MFFRSIALTFAITFATALAALGVTMQPGDQTGIMINGKRQDRLVPVGGFNPQQNHSGYGIDFYRKG